MSEELSILDIKRRHLTLLGDVDSDMLLKTLLGLDALEARSRTKRITITLSTIGGDAYECLAIYDRLRNSPCPITIIGTGHVMSSGTIILQAAEKRLLTPNTRFMIHYGSIELNEQSVIDASAYINFEKNVDRPLMEQIYFDKIKKKNKDYKLSQLQKLLQKDTFMTAEQAVELGLADELYNKNQKKEKEIKQQ